MAPVGDTDKCDGYGYGRGNRFRVRSTYWNAYWDAQQDMNLVCIRIWVGIRMGIRIRI